MKKAEQTFCTANNVKEPVYTWTPAVAPSGNEFYDKYHESYSNILSS